MIRRLQTISVFAFLLAAACGGTSGKPLRPGGSPDIVIFSFSGHDGVPSPPGCSFATNRAYLADTGEAVDALADLFNTLGFTGLVSNYSSRLEGVDLDMNGQIDADRRGFLELLTLMRQVHTNWMKGFFNPTRIVIVAHGHGAVWAHAAVSILSDIPVEYLITLDGICDDWECVHETVVAAYQQQNGNPWPWDVSEPCGRWSVTGQGALFDTEDVVFDNVVIAIEVQSDDTVRADDIDNRRRDGTRDGVFTFVAVGEDHNDVRLATSDAMDFVLDTINNREK